MLNNGIFISRISQVKAIEKKDSVWTSDQQIKRLLRPGSTYFNLNPYEVSSVSIRQLAVTMALCVYVCVCIEGEPCPLGAPTMCTCIECRYVGPRYLLFPTGIVLSHACVPLLTKWTAIEQVPRNLGKHCKHAVCFLAALSVSYKLRRCLTLSQ